MSRLVGLAVAGWLSGVSLAQVPAEVAASAAPKPQAEWVKPPSEAHPNQEELDEVKLELAQTKAELSLVKLAAQRAEEAIAYLMEKLGQRPPASAKRAPMPPPMGGLSWDSGKQVLVLRQFESLEAARVHLNNVAPQWSPALLGWREDNGKPMYAVVVPPNAPAGLPPQAAVPPEWAQAQWQSVSTLQKLKPQLLKF